MTTHDKLHKGNLAKRLGVSRVTLYRWLGLPDCPNPEVDMDGFLAWAKGKTFENGGRPTKTGFDDVAELKAAKLRADTIRQWQRVTEYRDVVRAEQEVADWSDIQDLLGEYQSELARAAIDDVSRRKLNNLLAKVMPKFSARVASAMTRRDAANLAMEDRLMTMLQGKG